jgi:hypothetical protein
MSLTGIIFVCGLCLGLVASRVTTVAARGDIEQQNRFFISLNFIGLIATLSYFVYGFVLLRWYWPVGVFIIGSALAGLAVNNQTLERLFRTLPLINLASIVIAVYLWAPIAPFWVQHLD